MYEGYWQLFVIKLSLLSHLINIEMLNTHLKKKKKTFIGAELCFAIMPLVWPYPTVLA